MSWQYQGMLRSVLMSGDVQENRTGIKTIMFPGLHARFDLRHEFPAVTVKSLPFKSVAGELVGFLRGCTSAADFRALGCKVWDQNANENAAWLANPHRLGTDDLGPIYGAVWRDWGGVDQLAECLRLIREEPTSRRILFHAWDVARLDKMALPPCHLLYQFHVNAARGELSMTLYLRSNDLGLGAPFNMAEGAMLLSLFARLTGLTPRWFNYMVGDAHIYVNHMDMVNEMLARDPMEPPTLRINKRVQARSTQEAIEWLDKVEPSDFELVDYQHHGALTAPMAV